MYYTDSKLVAVGSCATVHLLDGDGVILLHIDKDGASYKCSQRILYVELRYIVPAIEYICLSCEADGILQINDLRNIIAGSY